jgi:hypothetical protein
MRAAPVAPCTPSRSGRRTRRRRRWWDSPATLIIWSAPWPPMTKFTWLLHVRNIDRDRKATTNSRSRGFVGGTIPAVACATAGNTCGTRETGAPPGTRTPNPRVKRPIMDLPGRTGRCRLCRSSCVNHCPSCRSMPDEGACERSIRAHNVPTLIMNRPPGPPPPRSPVRHPKRTVWPPKALAQIS